ncbi:MAG TPA: WecB/TagA/CpsF family glycosyltransferase [Clostridia bacterium]|nr:WecB/TagA/CpsF family glycosyltransferase [Clostridia bacterium]
MMALDSLKILGTPLLLTDYNSLGAACCEWARSNRCVALDFANTQIVTMRRHEPAFRALTDSYDAFPPDGMPLIWCLNRAGASLKDRVYGPTFMRRFLEDVPGEFTHYLLGGSEECGRRLRATFEKINPRIRFVGSFHGRCSPDGQIEPAKERQVLDEIHRLSPDFIWVGFGTPKQQAFVTRYKPQIKRGVILTVGFAFDVNAGMKPDAPQWMQRLGLTWVYRFGSEPRRLGPRYIKYNFLFLWYLAWDGLRGRAWTRARA